jgi:hypothetical protein
MPAAAARAPARKKKTGAGEEKEGSRGKEEEDSSSLTGSLWLKEEDEVVVYGPWPMSYLPMQRLVQANQVGVEDDPTFTRVSYSSCYFLVMFVVFVAFPKHLVTLVDVALLM